MRVLHVARTVVAQPRRHAVLAERMRRAQRRRVQLLKRKIVVRLPRCRICGTDGTASVGISCQFITRGGAIRQQRSAGRGIVSVRQVQNPAMPPRQRRVWTVLTMLLPPSSAAASLHIPSSQEECYPSQQRKLHSTVQVGDLHELCDQRLHGTQRACGACHAQAGSTLKMLYGPGSHSLVVQQRQARRLNLRKTSQPALCKYALQH